MAIVQFQETIVTTDRSNKSIAISVVKTWQIKTIRSCINYVWVMRLRLMITTQKQNSNFSNVKKHSETPQPNKALQNWSKVKVMITYVFDSYSIVHHEYASKG